MSEKKESRCHYCGEPMRDEYHYVIKDGAVVMAHKNCYAKSKVSKSSLGIIIKGSGCPGGTCGL